MNRAHQRFPSFGRTGRSPSSPSAPIPSTPPTRVDFGRRAFLEALALAGGVLSVGGCDRLTERIEAMVGPDELLPVRPPDADSIDDVTHVLNRLTWGPRPDDRTRLLAASEESEAARRTAIDSFIDIQLEPEAIEDRRIERCVAELETAQVPRAELYEFPPELIAADLARERLLRAIGSRRQLFEIIADFWTDHLNIAISKGACRWMKLADDREVVRPHAMGRFRDLLRASLTSPAMLIALDGLDNKVRSRGHADVIHPDESPVDRPNENHARELLELHTLGLDGGYTQHDVMETARCLSGWTFTHDWRRFFTARVGFDPSRHDNGEKEILGQPLPAGGGTDDLERLLDILCRHPSTARHIATRLCRVFIADPPPARAVERVATAFLETDGRIRPTLRALFSCPAFRDDPAYRGALLKRPLRYVVSALRGTNARCDGGPGVMAHLRRMGHEPFQHPAPDGYPLEAQPWLGTLLWRWNFAIDLVSDAIPGATVDLRRLERRFNSSGALLAHLFGRRPTDAEREAIFGDASTQRGIESDSLVVALAAPGFQWH